MEGHMIKKNIIILIFFVFLLTACTSGGQPQQLEGCLENMPQNIPGLKVTGARSEKNVITNLWPFICKARELYRERLKENPKLKGTWELKFSVEFNGEIGPWDITRNTLEDSLFEQRLLRLISFMDFDSYGPHNSESEIFLPIHFDPYFYFKS
jgi:hypothetical protein